MCHLSRNGIWLDVSSESKWQWAECVIWAGAEVGWTCHLSWNGTCLNVSFEPEWLLAKCVIWTRMAVDYARSECILFVCVQLRTCTLFRVRHCFGSSRTVPVKVMTTCDFSFMLNGVTYCRCFVFTYLGLTFLEFLSSIPFIFFSRPFFIILLFSPSKRGHFLYVLVCVCPKVHYSVTFPHHARLVVVFTPPPPPHTFFFLKYKTIFVFYY